jgi:hypothetical protein
VQDFDRETAIVNALPRTTDELATLGFSKEEWPAWQGVYERFAALAPGTSETKTATATKASALTALSSRECVLFVYAHSDGATIRFPNGEVLHVEDIASISDAIRQNRPRVFLFSCESGRATDAGSFAKSLLDAGAGAVVAPATLISVDDAYKLMRALVSELLQNPKSTVEDAFRKAIKAGTGAGMEVWLSSLNCKTSFDLCRNTEIGTVISPTSDVAVPPKSHA